MNITYFVNFRNNWSIGFNLYVHKNKNIGI